MRLLACLIVAPQRVYDEPAILSYAISSFCPTGADGLHRHPHDNPDLLIECDLVHGQDSCSSGYGGFAGDTMLRGGALFQIPNMPSSVIPIRAPEERTL